MTRILIALFALFLLVPQTGLTQETLPERLREQFWTQGEQVRSAFVPVIRDARRATVQFRDGSKTVALGTIVDAEGWIITKASQMSDAKECHLFDSRQVPFEYVGYDPSLDLALIRIKASRLTPIEWETTEPRLGDWVITTGPEVSPLAVGVISVPRRQIEKSDSYGVLGIALADTYPDVSAVIESVFPNSGAAKAGLEVNDEVLSINDKPVTGRVDLIRTIHNYRPGDTVVVEVKRQGDKQTFSVTLTHPFGDFLSRIAFQQQLGGPLSFRRDDFEAVFQHDTVLQPEQCGGPVVNLEGHALGINIARAGRTASYLLPADMILPRVNELKTGNFPPPSVTQNPPVSDPDETVNSP